MLAPSENPEAPNEPQATPPQKRRREDALEEIARWTKEAYSPFAAMKVSEQLEKYYVLKAMHGLNTDEDSSRFMYINNSENPKLGILGALGHFQDQDQMREAAANICQNKMLSKNAVSYLFNLLNGGTLPREGGGLPEEIAGIIKSYKKRHPATTNVTIRDALDLNYPVSQSEAGEDAGDEWEEDYEVDPQEENT